MHLAIPLLSLLVLVKSQCFYPNGSTAGNNFPCNPGAANSVCCVAGTICTDNGICMDLTPGDSVFNRGSCTDQEWDDLACPTFCKEANPGSYEQMAACGNDGTFVCQQDDSACSEAANQVSLGIPVPYAVPSSGSASKITPAGIAITSSGSAGPTTTPSVTSSQAVASDLYGGTSPTASPSADAVGASSSSNGISEPTKVGLAVGIPVSVVGLVVVAAVCFFIGRRKAGREATNRNQFGSYGYHEMTDPMPYQGQSSIVGTPGAGVPTGPPKPLAATPGYGYSTRAEADHSEQRPELPPDESRGELQG